MSQSVSKSQRKSDTLKLAQDCCTVPVHTVGTYGTVHHVVLAILARFPFRPGTDSSSFFRTNSFTKALKLSLLLY
jgi:hypothetical protein